MTISGEVVNALLHWGTFWHTDGSETPQPFANAGCACCADTVPPDQTMHDRVTDAAPRSETTDLPPGSD